METGGGRRGNESGGMGSLRGNQRGALATQGYNGVLPARGVGHGESLSLQSLGEARPPENKRRRGQNKRAALHIGGWLFARIKGLAEDSMKITTLRKADA